MAQTMRQTNRQSTAEVMPQQLNRVPSCELILITPAMMF
jgi:hypothetical protein